MSHSFSDQIAATLELNSKDKGLFFKSLLLKAHAGSKKTPFDVAQVYLKSAEDSVNKVLFWMEKSASQYYAPAEFALGAIYLGGTMVERDIDKAKEYLERSADSGFDSAIILLSIAYKDAVYGMENEILCAKYMIAAANIGHPGSQTNLGTPYEQGYGGEKNARKAVYWYKKSSGQGCQTGMTNLSRCYFLGIGTDIDEKKGERCLREAAALGSVLSQMELGRRCGNSHFGVIDYDESLFWYSKALIGGHPSAQKCIDFIVTQQAKMA